MAALWLKRMAIQAGSAGILVFVWWCPALATSLTLPAQPELCHGLAREVALACQSWTEIAQAQKEGTDRIIIPVGGTEQSGPYMAVGKHNRRAEILAGLIAQKMGHTYTAPVIAYVPEGGTEPRTGHMRFPGTISIPPAAFSALVEGVAESLRVQGFRLIILLGDHGGYQAQLGQIATRLNKRWAHQERKAAHVLFVPAYYSVIAGRYANILRQQGHGAEIGQHAELSDTSLMLAVDASLVRQENLRQAPRPGPADGVYGGDPRQATPLLGRIGCEMQIQEASQAIMSFERKNP